MFFSSYYLCNCSTADISVFSFDVNWPKKLFPEVRKIPFESSCILEREKERTQKRVYINKIQQDTTDAGIYLLQNHSTCFGCLSHPSSGVHKTVTAASGTGHITYQGNDLLPAWPRWQKVVALIRDMTCTRSRSYSLMYSWRWVR